MSAAGEAGPPGRAGDFDFYVGSWASRHRRLRTPLAGCDEWYEFTATTRCWSLFGGAANIDELSVPDQGFSGLTVRLLDPATGDWSLSTLPPSATDGLTACGKRSAICHRQRSADRATHLRQDSGSTPATAVQRLGRRYWTK